jgi:5-methylcytosine-specific restriction endonuclease McrBC GTP-binding regulatory subunit McrB
MTKQLVREKLNQIDYFNVQQAFDELRTIEIPRNRQSIEYDVIDPTNGDAYPPPFLIEHAYSIATGGKLPEGFFNSIGKNSIHFKFLEGLGFEIKEKKKLMLVLIENFIKQGNTNNLKTSTYPKEYNGLPIKVSFGQGVPARIPWIGLVKSPNTIQKGVYPVFLYYKEFNKLVLAYGISETDKSEFDWSNTENLTTIRAWHIQEFNKAPDRYGSSFIKNVYDLSTDLDKDMIDKDLNEIIDEYEKINFGKNGEVKYWLFAPGENASKWEEFYNEGVMGLGWGELGNLKELGDKNQITKEIQTRYKTKSASYNNALANLDFRDTIQIGDIIIPKRGRKEYLGYGIVMSDYYYDDFSNEYKSRRKVNWIKKGIWPEKTAGIVLKTLTDITKYPDYVEELRKLIGIEMEEQETITVSEIKRPLNQILYGPPGTGKTYNTVLEAAKIVSGNALISYGEALEEFNKKLGNQIEFITFHQNYSYEDFIQGIRPDTENGKELSFEKKDGVFKRIADRALKNITDSEQPESAKKDFDAVFQDFIVPLIDEDEIEVKMKKTSFYITQISEKSIEFRKNQGDSQHTLSINTLRKMYNDGVNEIILGGLQPYYNPILQVLLEKGKSQFTPVEKKNFVIIIDEINRANISRVFGELITLIEEDKRYGGKIPMRVTLPSGDSFIVPSNLYIIGTMNTADKSIALLDIALRRRFEFVPKYPDYTIAGVHEPETLLLLNKAIQSRKGYDFTIGHAYFMGDDYTLVNTVNKKVIPLLLEYFMNNEDEVIKIFKEANITIGGWPLKMIL